MPFSSSDIIQLELKYCERCGGLRLRPKDSPVHYCVPCRRLLDEMAPARYHRGRRNSPRPRQFSSAAGPQAVPAPVDDGRLA